MTEKSVEEPKIFCSKGRKSLRNCLKNLDASLDGGEAWEKITRIKFSCGRLLDNLEPGLIDKIRVHHLIRWEQYREGFYPTLAPKDKRPKNALGMAFFAIDHIFSKKRG